MDSPNENDAASFQSRRPIMNSMDGCEPQKCDRFTLGSYITNIEKVDADADADEMKQKTKVQIEQWCARDSSNTFGPGVFRRHETHPLEDVDRRQEPQRKGTRRGLSEGDGRAETDAVAKEQFRTTEETTVDVNADHACVEETTFVEPSSQPCHHGVFNSLVTGADPCNCCEDRCPEVIQEEDFQIVVGTTGVFFKKNYDGFDECDGFGDLSNRIKSLNIDSHMDIKPEDTSDNSIPFVVNNSIPVVPRPCHLLMVYGRHFLKLKVKVELLNSNGVCMKVIPGHGLCHLVSAPFKKDQSSSFIFSAERHIAINTNVSSLEPESLYLFSARVNNQTYYMQVDQTRSNDLEVLEIVMNPVARCRIICNGRLAKSGAMFFFRCKRTPDLILWESFSHPNYYISFEHQRVAVRCTTFPRANNNIDLYEITE